VETSPRYTAMVRRYWARHRPAATSQLPDAEAFFRSLGTQIATQVVSVSHQMLGEDRPWESPMEKMGRVNSTTKQAEELVLAELLYSATPELDPVAELEELLGRLPGTSLIQDALSDMDWNAQERAEAEGSSQVWFTPQEEQERQRLLALMPLVDLSTEQLDSMSPQQAEARIQALRKVLGEDEPQ
jgi:hypothetical protein